RSPLLSSPSLHDALPILEPPAHRPRRHTRFAATRIRGGAACLIRLSCRSAPKIVLNHDFPSQASRWNSAAARRGAITLLERYEKDRKSTRLNSSHVKISY